jgi:holliday junction DNA helicase RuvA
MFEYVKGTLVEITGNFAVIDVNGIGYKLMVSSNISKNSAVIKKDILFFVSFVVREDSQTLYGFLKKEERNLFELLLTLSGIGPKTALSIVGHLEIDHLQEAIAKEDIFIISKIPGIGKKTAQRLIIELKDKFNFNIMSECSSNMKSNNVSDALNALMNLGYGMHEAKIAIDKILKESEEPPEVSTLISAALRKI